MLILLFPKLEVQCPSPACAGAFYICEESITRKKCLTGLGIFAANKYVMCDNYVTASRTSEDWWANSLRQTVHLLQDRSQNKSQPLSNLCNYGKTILFLFHSISQYWSIDQYCEQFLHRSFYYIPAIGCSNQNPLLGGLLKQKKQMEMTLLSGHDSWQRARSVTILCSCMSGWYVEESWGGMLGGTQCRRQGRGLPPWLATTITTYWPANWPAHTKLRPGHGMSCLLPCWCLGSWGLCWRMGCVTPRKSDMRRVCLGWN